MSFYDITERHEPFDQEVDLLVGITYFVRATMHHALARRGDLEARRRLHEARNGLATALRQYGAWLQSEDGRSRLARWDAACREAEAEQEKSCGGTLNEAPKGDGTVGEVNKAQ